MANLGGDQDQDEVVVHLLGLVLQVLISAFVEFGFGLTGEDL